MSQPRAFYRSGTLTINGSATAYLDNLSAVSGTTTDTVIQFNGYWDYAVIQDITTSSLAIKVYVSYNNGTTFEPANSFDAAGAGTAADSAVTPSAGDVLRFMVAGATHIKISRTAGSGTLTVFASSGFPEVNVIGMGTLSGALKAEDSVAASGDLGLPALAVRANTAAATGANGDYVNLITDTNGALWVSLSTLLAGEDQTNGVMKVEHQYGTSGALLTDTTVKSGAGFLHAITISQNDAAPTAGTIDVYDNTAGSGTKLFTWTLTTAVFTPFTVHIDCSFATGLYVDFTTTADVAVFCSYR